MPFRFGGDAVHVYLTINSIVREIISQDHGSEDVSPFAAWPWADFGKVMGDELIAQNVARYPAKGAELGQSQS